jgi:FkbM family methyltransferase
MLIDLRSSMERHVYWRADAEDSALRLLANLLPSGGQVLDVGANIGFFTVPLARLLERGGKVYAFEPVPANFLKLCDNLRLNGLESSAEPYHLALGSAPALAEIHMDDTPQAITGNACVNPLAPAPGDTFAGADAKGTIEPWHTLSPVRIATLDQWSAERKPERCDLMKIDVEGGEYAVFQAAGDFLRRYRPVIYCELNHRRMRTCRWTEHDLVDLLRPAAYGMHHHRRGRLQPGCVGGPRTENVFLIPQERTDDVAASLARPLANLSELCRP